MITAASLLRRAACCRAIAHGAAQPALTRDLLLVARAFEDKARRLEKWYARGPSQSRPL